MPNAFASLKCSKKCQHNVQKPTSITITSDVDKKVLKEKQKKHETKPNKSYLVKSMPYIGKEERHTSA